eukprot:54314_1
MLCLLLIYISLSQTQGINCCDTFENCDTCHDDCGIPCDCTHNTCSSEPCRENQQEPTCSDCTNRFVLTDQGFCELSCEVFENCKVAFDGCNICSCDSGICTLFYCATYEDAKCHECQDGFDFNLDGECVPLPSVSPTQPSQQPSQQPSIGSSDPDSSDSAETHQPDENEAVDALYGNYGELSGYDVNINNNDELSGVDVNIDNNDGELNDDDVNISNNDGESSDDDVNISNNDGELSDDDVNISNNDDELSDDVVNINNNDGELNDDVNIVNNGSFSNMEYYIKMTLINMWLIFGLLIIVNLIIYWCYCRMNKIQSGRMCVDDNEDNDENV